VPERLADIAASKWFQRTVTCAILLAGVLVGVETDAELAARHAGLLHFLDRVVLSIFVAEIVVKMGAEGRRPWRFFGDAWNCFDFVIVAACLVPAGSSSVTVLRLLRLLRVLRLVRALPKLQLLVNALLKSIPSMGYVSLLLGLLFYIYAVAGVFLFGANDPVHFSSLGIAMLSLFRVVTLEDWTDVMYTQMQGCAEYGYDAMPELCVASQASPAVASFFFVSFVLLGTMVVLNLFIGVIMMGMEEASREQEGAEGEGGAPPSALAEPSRVRELEEQLLELQLKIQVLVETVRDVVENGGRDAVPGSPEEDGRAPRTEGSAN